MKLGLIADIHCNLHGLRKALDLLADCDEVLCAGDLMYQYRFSNDVLALLQERGVRSIVGNHDQVVLHTPSHPLRSSPQVDPHYLDYLAGLPRELRLFFNGTDVAVFHGSPWDTDDQSTYIYPQDTASLRRVASVEADLVVLGHTHVPFVEHVQGTIVVNPGSCSEPRDGTTSASCAVYDTASGKVEFRRFALS